MAKSNTKYPSGPVKAHKSLATGESYAEANSEAKVGGSKKDKSGGSNK
jgi:hypothetical protein